VYVPFLALRYLRSRLVNFIAVGGVMVGVAVLIVVTGVMDGFREKVLEILRGNLSDIVMTPISAPHEPLAKYETISREILQDPRVHATSPQVEGLVFYMYPAYHRSQLRVGDHAVFQMRAVGIDFAREKEVSKIKEYLITANDPERPFFSPRVETHYKEGSIIVSRTFAENFLGLEKDRTLLPVMLLEKDVGVTFVKLEGDGDTSGGGGNVSATWSTYQLPISAIYDGQDTSLDASRVYMRSDVLRRLAHIEDEYQTIRVKLKDPEDAQQVKKDFLARFPDYSTLTWQDHRRDYLRAVNNEKVLLAIVLSFIVLLGGFIILATLTLTVVEKTRDIGVLSALGATRGGILKLFVGNGLLIGVLGAVLGIGLGRLFQDNVNTIKDWLSASMGIEIFPSDIYLFREIPTIWSWGAVLWIAGGSIVMAFVAGLIPALRAARMDPVRALRHE
jgi:lipoprotein-releasing system permease protein